MGIASGLLLPQSTRQRAKPAGSCSHWVKPSLRSLHTPSIRDVLLTEGARGADKTGLQLPEFLAMCIKGGLSGGGPAAFGLGLGSAVWSRVQLTPKRD